MIHHHPSSPSSHARRPQARAIAIARPRQLHYGTALFVLVLGMLTAMHARAEDDLPPLPPLPGMDVASSPAAPTTPALKEMPALPAVEAPKAVTASPSLENARIGQTKSTPDLPPMMDLPRVPTREDIAFRTTGNPSVSVADALPEARNVGPAEIDGWLKNGQTAPIVASTDSLPPLPTLPSDIPDTAKKVDTAAAKNVAKTDAPAVEKEADKTADVVKEKPKKKAVAKKAPEPAQPFYSFQYKSQFLPDAIYRPTYSAENKHLPKARYEQDYDKYLFQAAARNDAASVRALMNTPGRNVEAFDPSGQTPLMVAVRYGAVDAAQTLLSYGANADHRDNSGVSILHYAVLARNPALVQSLLVSHANPQSRDPWGQTPLDLANFAKDTVSISLLRSAMQPQQATLGQPRS